MIRDRITDFDPHTLFCKDIIPIVKFDMIPSDYKINVQGKIIYDKAIINREYHLILKDVCNPVIRRFNTNAKYLGFKCIILGGFDELGFAKNKEYEMHFPIITFSKAWYEAVGYKTLTTDSVWDVEIVFEKHSKKKIRFKSREYIMIPIKESVKGEDLLRTTKQR